MKILSSNRAVLELRPFKEDITKLSENIKYRNIENTFKKLWQTS